MPLYSKISNEVPWEAVYLQELLLLTAIERLTPIISTDCGRIIIMVEI